MQAYGILVVYLHSFLTSALYGRYVAYLGRLISGNELAVPTGLMGWMGPRAGMTAFGEDTELLALPFVEPKG
jgi:hypothetical protein